MLLTHKFPDPLNISLTIPEITVVQKDPDDTQSQAQLAEQISTAVSAALAAKLAPKFQEILTDMATYADDIAKLTTDVDANTAAVQKLVGLDASDKTIIADLKAQIEALKAAGTVDTTALEANIAKLEANNQAATSAAPAPDPTPVPTPVPPTPPTPPTTGSAPTA